MKLLTKLLLFFSFLFALQGNCNVSFSQELKYIKNDTLPKMFYLTYTEVPSYSMKGYICVKQWVLQKEKIMKQGFVINPRNRRSIFKFSVKGKKDLQVVIRDYNSQVVVLKELFITKEDNNLVLLSEKAKMYIVEISNLSKNPVDILYFVERYPK
jgi:hypothetical protein